MLALWLSERGWRAPVEARPAVGLPMPLLLPVPVRALTLVAIRDLSGEEMMALEGVPERAPWLLRRAAARRPVSTKSSPIGALAGRGAALAERRAAVLVKLPERPTKANVRTAWLSATLFRWLEAVLRDGSDQRSAAAARTA